MLNICQMFKRFVNCFKSTKSWGPIRMIGKSNDGLENRFYDTKTKVIFTVHDFDANRESVFRSEEFSIKSNVWQIIIQTNYMLNGESVFTITLLLKTNKHLFVRFDSFIYGPDMKKKIQFLDKGFANFSPNLRANNPMITTKKFLAQKDSFFPKKRLRIGVIITVRKNVYEWIAREFPLRKTFNCKDLSDFQIFCGSQQFFVSKAILSSHSIVFEKIFTRKLFTRRTNQRTNQMINQLWKQKTNQLVIEDIDGKVFEEFLKFIYFGNSDKLEELKEYLIIIADRYQVLNLKKICGNLMYIEMCSSNAIKYLIAFNKSNSNHMVEKTIEYISKNVPIIRENTPKEWQELIKKDNKLLGRITEKMGEVIKGGKISAKPIKDNLNYYTFSFIN